MEDWINVDKSQVATVVAKKGDNGFSIIGEWLDEN